MTHEPDLKFYCDDMRHIVCVPHSIPNLHKMAKALDIKRCWFHSGGRYPHYDMPKKRIKEITARCNLVDCRVILKIIKGEPP